MAADEHDAQDDPSAQPAWLDAQQPYTAIAGAGGIIIEHESDDFDAVITDRPPAKSLTVMCRQRFDLRASTEAGDLRGSTVHLVADESTRTPKPHCASAATHP